MIIVLKTVDGFGLSFKSGNNFNDFKNNLKGKIKNKNIKILAGSDNIFDLHKNFNLIYGKKNSYKKLCEYISTFPYLWLIPMPN